MELTQRFVMVFLLAGLMSLSLPSETVAEKQNESQAPQQELQCALLPQLFSTYLAQHIEAKKIDSAIQKRTLKNYVQEVDPLRLLLRKSEAKAFKQNDKLNLKEFDEEACQELDELNQKLVKRNKHVEDFVRETVQADDFELNNKVEVFVDPEDRGYPETQKEQHEILTRQIHFQIFNYLENGLDLEKAKERIVHRYELRTKRAKEQNRQERLISFLDSFASALDPHSKYMSAEQLKNFRIQMGLSLQGIGVTLTNRDGFTIVEKIVPGGAADQEGTLQPKDRIVAVKEKEKGKTVNIVDKELQDVVKMIRGKKGTDVTLTVLRRGEKKKRFKVTITRDKIDLKQRAAKLHYETLKKPGKKGEKQRFAVIKLPSFYGDDDPDKRSSFRDVKKLLKKVEKQDKPVDGLMLDLSKNGGGLLKDSVRISGLFIKKGGVVTAQMSNDKKKVLKDENGDILYSGPMVVLTSRISASASEILAGALKDYDRAVVVGDDHTFGKGTIQSVVGLPEGLGALKITTGKFYRPGGRSTQHAGVSSDVVVPSSYSTDEIGEKALDYSLPGDQREPFISDKANADNPKNEDYWEPVSDKVVDQLAKRSSKRTENSEAFEEIREQIQEAEEEQSKVKLTELQDDQQEKNSTEEDSSNSSQEGENPSSEGKSQKTSDSSEKDHSSGKQEKQDQKKTAKEGKSESEEKKSPVEKMRDEHGPRYVEALRVLRDFVNIRNGDPKGKVLTQSAQSSE